MAEAGEARAGRSASTLAVASFLAAALLLGLAAFAYAQLNTRTVLACDRTEDACVLSARKPFWTEERDRFKASHLREASYEERSRGKSRFACAVLTVSSRSDRVEICGRSGPDYVESLKAFIADPSKPRFEAVRDVGGAGRLLVVILAGFALAPLLAGLYLLRRARRAR